MGKLDDYVTSLDGQSELTVEGVVSEMLKLHNEEIGIANAKIATQDETIASHASVVTEKDTEITRLKSVNWDLANHIPGEQVQEPASTTDGKPDGAHITFDDLFEGK